MHPAGDRLVFPSTCCSLQPPLDVVSCGLPQLPSVWNFLLCKGANAMESQRLASRSWAQSAYLQQKRQELQEVLRGKDIKKPVSGEQIISCICTNQETIQGFDFSINWHTLADIVCTSFSWLLANQMPETGLYRDELHKLKGSLT